MDCPFADNNNNNTEAAESMDGPFTDNKKATSANSRDTTAADCRDGPFIDNKSATAVNHSYATAADCMDCPVTDNRNATTVGRKDDVDIDLEVIQLLTTAADLSHTATNGWYS